MGVGLVLIVIDYDETYTEDKMLWNMFVTNAKLKSHTVVCCTMRDNDISVKYGNFEGGNLYKACVDNYDGVRMSDFHETYWGAYMLSLDTINTSIKTIKDIVYCNKLRKIMTINNYNLDVITDMHMLDVPVVFAGEYKDKWYAMEDHGYIVENAIWIDDTPDLIYKNI